MPKVNDCCWAAGTDPENKYVSKKLETRTTCMENKIEKKENKVLPFWVFGDISGRSPLARPRVHCMI